MSVFDSYRSRLTALGSTKRERDKNKIQQRIENEISQSLSNKEVLINGEPRNLVCINVEKKNEKEIRSFPNETFNSGDFVYFCNSYWLITKIDTDDEIYTWGTMERCDLLVRWQNVETLDIIERWAIVERPYSSNLDKDKIITSPKKEFILKFQSDEETRKIGVNRRFLIYSMYDIKTMKEVPIASVVQAYNPVNTIGIVEINIVEDASFNVATDNAELMIADYIDPTITVNLIPIPELLRGDSIQIKYEFYQQNRLLDIAPIFESSDKSIAIVSETGLITSVSVGRVDISVKYKDAIGTININVVNMSISDRILTVTGSDSIRHKRESEYSGYIFDNGVKQFEKVVWSIDKMNLSNPIPTLTIINDNSVKVTIPDNTNNLDKKFKLICRDELNTLSIEKQITIVSAFA